MKSDILRCRHLHAWYKIKEMHNKRKPEKTQTHKEPWGVQPTVNSDLRKNQYCKVVWGGGGTILVLGHFSRRKQGTMTVLCSALRRPRLVFWGIALARSVEKLERIHKINIFKRVPEGLIRKERLNSGISLSQ